MKLSESLRSRLYAVCLILLLLFSGLGLTFNRGLERLDLMLYDQMLPAHAVSMSDQVVIVAIDDYSLQQLGRWPWSRKRHAELVYKLTEMDAAVIGIDVLFVEPEKNDPEADEVFAEALARSGRSVLSIAPGVQMPGSLISEVMPLPDLAVSAEAIGHVDVELDVDGLCRRFFLYSGVGDARWPALAMAMLRVKGETEQLDSLINVENTPVIRSDYWLRQQSIMIPFAKTGDRPQTYSWADIISGRVPAEAIRGKYVLVGATATGLGDALSTPAAAAHERIPGVELNAHILNALLRGEGINQVSSAWYTGITLAFIIVVTLAVVLLPLRAGLVFTLVALWSIPALSLTLLVGWKLWFAPAAALIIVALPWPLWNVWQLGIDARLKHKLLQQLAHQVQHHVATGLPNAVMLRQRLNRAIAEQQGAESCVGLLVIHFNWSGSASTTLECPVDDTQLKKVGSLLREVISDEHFIAHLNGDDFAVLLTDLQEVEHVKDAALSLLQALQKPLKMDDDSYLLLTPRIGASAWPDDCFDADGLIRNAYTAMFKSRVDDSDTLCVYSQGAGLQLELRSQVEQALVHALERNEFEVYYQPQVRADDGRMVGVEALLRWNSPQLGRIPPGIFIPVAEHVGLIPMIGSWVLKTACEQLQDWHDAGLPGLRLAINVSPLQFADPELERRLAQTIKNMSIAPGNIELEITEGSLMWDMDQAVNIMKRMKTQGVDLAVDDFGTGYSSLSSLRHFPLDRLKIDQSFTREIGSDDAATEITQTIISMGKRLGLRIIAEGVETADQARFLREHGCDELQGHYFGRPLDADQITDLLVDIMIADSSKKHASSEDTEESL